MKKTDEEKKQYLKEYYAANKERISNQKKEKYNKENTKITNSDYRLKNKERINTQKRLAYDKNKTLIKEQRKAYYAENKESIKKRIKVNYEKNKTDISNKSKIYYQKNKEKINETKKRYNQIRCMNDPLYKLKINIRCLISITIKNNGFKKSSKTEQILGCTIEQFKVYLESKFESWMSWDNRGLYKKDTFNYGWDIDHIIPISSAITENDVIRLNHYTNLQPLCSYVNRNIKKGKLII